MSKHIVQLCSLPSTNFTLVSLVWNQITPCCFPRQVVSFTHLRAAVSWSIWWRQRGQGWASNTQECGGQKTLLCWFDPGIEEWRAATCANLFSSSSSFCLSLLIRSMFALLAGDRIKWYNGLLVLAVRMCSRDETFPLTLNLTKLTAVLM